MEIKRRASGSFESGDNYDALWKYEHALLLCHSYPWSFKADMAALHSNIAAVCLKMGDFGNEELLDPKLLPPNARSRSVCSQVCWYVFTQQHTSKALLDLDPESESEFVCEVMNAL